MTKQFYKNFELVHKIKRIANLKNFASVIFMTALLSKLYAISYSMTIKTLCIICLHFIKN